MPNSPEFQEYKRLYHEEHQSIKNASITDGTGTVVFEDPADGSKTTVTGDAEDFIHAIWAIKNTVRDGEDELIDVTDTPAGSIEQYYDNMEPFLPDDTGRDPEEEMHREVQQILTGEKTLCEVDLHPALDAAVNRDMENPELHGVIEDYYTVRASQLIYLKAFSELFESLPRDVIFDYDRFMRAYSDMEDILRKEYLTKSPERAYEEYRNQCNSDIEKLTEQLLGERSLSKKEWRGLLTGTGGSHSDADGVTIEMIDREFIGQEDIPDHAHGEVDGETAIRRVLKEYAYYYETVEIPFRDLVATLQGEGGDVELESTGAVMEWLDGNDDLPWTWAVVPEFRNGASHLGVETDNENGRVRVYESKERDREPTRELSYADVREVYRGFVDVVMAAVWAFTLTDQMLQFEYLQSRDFMFTVIENLPPETL